MAIGECRAVLVCFYEGIWKAEVLCYLNADGSSDLHDLLLFLLQFLFLFLFFSLAFILWP